MYIRMLGTLAIASLIAAAPENVNVDADPSAAFSTYNTYAWTAGTPSPDPVTVRQIHGAVEAQFALKQTMLAEPDETPDVYAATHVLSREHKEFAGRSYPAGTLIVEIYDPKLEKTVWRGIAAGIGSDKRAKSADKIENALTSMFKQYPRTSE